MRTFLQFVADSRYLPSWLFLATTGCRRGECPGLRWADLDLERSTAIPGHQVVLLNGKIQIKERSKTKRNHLIRLDTGTVAMLRNWRVRQNEMRQLAGAGFKRLRVEAGWPLGPASLPFGVGNDRVDELVGRGPDRDSRVWRAGLLPP